MIIEISKKFVDDEIARLSARQKELRCELDRIHKAREKSGNNDLYHEEWKNVTAELGDILKQCIEWIDILAKYKIKER